MYRPHSEPGPRIVLGGLILLAALLVGGCASTGPATRPALSEEAGPTPTRERPARSARVKVEPNIGFTVTEVVALSSDVREMYHEALALLARNDLEAGIALLVTVTERSPDATAPFIDLGIAHRRAGERDKAIASFTEALASTPDHPVAHNELGITYRELGRFDEARRSYEQALTIYPGFHYARRNLAVLCDIYLADLACALEHYERYSQDIPDDREVEIWVGDVRNRMPVTDEE